MGNPFTNLLSDLQNPADKEILQKLSPDGQKFLSEAAMRQSDFSRNHDEFKRLQDAAKAWEPWQTGQRPEWERRYNEYPKVETRAQELERQYAAAKAEIDALKAATPNSEGQIDVTKLSQAVKDSLLNELKPVLGNLITREEANKIREDAVKTAWNQSAGDLLPNAMATLELSNRYYREFGEPITGDAILKVAAESGRKGQEALDFAWNKLAGPKLEAKRQADVDAKIKAAREEGLNEGLSRAQTHGNLPPGMDEGTNFPFAKPVSKIEELSPDYEIGAKGGFQLAGIAAEELRRMGAARTQGQG